MPMQSAVLLVVLGALWGGSFVFMRIAVPALSAIPLAFVRVSLAAIALLAFAYLRESRVRDDFRRGEKSSLTLHSRWRDFAVVGIVNSAMPFALFSYAAQHLPVSMSAILNATSPFFGAIAAAIWLGEPLTWRKSMGMALGFAGVAVLVGWHPEGMSREVVYALAACVIAAICYALGSTYTKRKLGGVPSLTIAAASQTAAAIALLPALPFTSVPGPVTAAVIGNVIALALLSTAVAYMIFFKLIADIGPARALAVTFLIPLFGALWGYLFLGEALTANMLAGGALIVAGTAITLRR